MIPQETLHDLYDAHNRELFIYILGLVHDHDTAEDLLQDVFVRLIQYSIKKTPDMTNIRAMLFRIARNASIDYLRRKETVRFEPIDSEHTAQREDSAGEALELDDLQRIIAEHLSRFDEVSRSVFTMRVELEYTYGEIAELLGISERTAKRKMKALLVSLSDTLEKDGYTFSVISVALLLYFIRYII